MWPGNTRNYHTGPKFLNAFVPYPFLQFSHILKFFSCLISATYLPCLFPSVFSYFQLLLLPLSPSSFWGHPNPILLVTPNSGLFFSCTCLFRLYVSLFSFSFGLILSGSFSNSWGIGPSSLWLYYLRTNCVPSPTADAFTPIFMHGCDYFTMPISLISVLAHRCGWFYC